MYQASAGASAEDGIWVKRSDGSETRELAPVVADVHLHPDWSPDGDRIVFEVQVEKKEHFGP